MEMNQLIYFRAVANSGSVTKAAEELFITQSALSRTIQRLELEVGSKLFIRDKGRFELSENGRVFLSHVQMALGELERAIQEIDQNEHRTTIRVYSFLFPGLLENYCEQLQAEYPELTFELRNSAGREGMEAFEAFEPEIVVTPIGEYRNYLVHGTYVEKWCILYHQQHKFAEVITTNGISAQQLVREPIVFFGSNYDKSFVQKTLDASVYQASMLQEQNLIDFRRVILQRKYIAAAPQWFCYRLLARQEKLPLAMCQVFDSPFLRPIHICRKNGYPKNELEQEILYKFQTYLNYIMV